MVRININDVEIEKINNNYILNGKEQANQLDKNVEAFSHLNKNFVDLNKWGCNFNPLIAAVYISFANHIPLEFTPDLIYNVILQSISQHVQINPEKYRHIFCTHQGKKQLVTQNDSLIKGDYNNNWEVSIKDLGNQIINNIPSEKIKDLVNTKFSTTLIPEETAHISVFMDIVKHYFEYKVVTRCGIPYIDVMGTQTDWKNLKEKIKSILLELELNDWYYDLEIILNNFINAFDNIIDKDFWDKIYNFYGYFGSGGCETISGWIIKFFLYIDGEKNQAIGNDKIVQYDPDIFPKGITKTEFIWEYFSNQYKMYLIAGNVGVSINENNALKPEIGWLISENK